MTPPGAGYTVFIVGALWTVVVVLRRISRIGLVVFIVGWPIEVVILLVDTASTATEVLLVVVVSGQTPAIIVCLGALEGPLLFDLGLFVLVGRLGLLEYGQELLSLQIDIATRVSKNNSNEARYR